MSRLKCDKCGYVLANTIMVLVRGVGVVCINCYDTDKKERSKLIA